MTDSPRQRNVAATDSTSNGNNNNTKPSEQQLAEEREKRRERLLASRDARLSKIVSSVGGTSYTPPSSIGSPANIVTRKPSSASTPSPAAAASHLNTSSVAANEQVQVNRPLQQQQHQQQHQPQHPRTTVPWLSPEKRQTVLVLLVHVGGLLAAWNYLGRQCFQSVFTDTAALKGDCMDKFEVFKKAYFGLLASMAVPIIVSSVRSGNYLAILSSVISLVSMSIALLTMVGWLVGKI